MSIRCQILWLYSGAVRGDPTQKKRISLSTVSPASSMVAVIANAIVRKEDTISLKGRIKADCTTDGYDNTVSSFISSSRMAATNYTNDGRTTVCKVLLLLSSRLQQCFVFATAILSAYASRMMGFPADFITFLQTELTNSTGGEN